MNQKADFKQSESNSKNQDDQAIFCIFSREKFNLIICLNIPVGATVPLTKLYIWVSNKSTN